MRSRIEAGLVSLFENIYTYIKLGAVQSLSVSRVFSLLVLCTYEAWLESVLHVSFSVSPLSWSADSGTGSEPPRFVPWMVQLGQRGSASRHPSLPGPRPLFQIDYAYITEVQDILPFIVHTNQDVRYITLIMIIEMSLALLIIERSVALLIIEMSLALLKVYQRLFLVIQLYPINLRS